MPGPRTVVGMLILANVVVYLANYLLDDKLTRFGAATPGTLTQPWLWWQFVTYGFLHDPRSLSHIIGNMLGLFFLGRDIEDHYGSKEFLRLYLALIVFGGVVWAAAEMLKGPALKPLPLVGASGAVVGIVVLYALNFPRRTLYLNFLIPVPAWFLGVMIVAFDLVGALSRGNGQQSDMTAYAVHIAGSALALVYFLRGWNFGRWWPDSFSSLSRSVRRLFRRRPKLRVHVSDEPEPQEDSGSEEGLSEEVDRILEKISRDGEASLTAAERRTLETASRQYQKRRRS